MQSKRAANVDLDNRQVDLFKTRWSVMSVFRSVGLLVEKMDGGRARFDAPPPRSLAAVMLVTPSLFSFEKGALWMWQTQEKRLLFFKGQQRCD